MGFFANVATWVTDINKKEVTDAVLGGAEDAPANLGEQGLVRRTSWLRERLLAGGVATSTTFTGDMNTLTTAGTHYATGAASNRPSGTSAGWVLVINDGSVSVSQTFFNTTSARVFTRRSTGVGTFSSWQQIVLDNNVSDEAVLTTFGNGWTAIVGETSNVIRTGRTVHLTLAIKDGQTNLDILTLAAAYRPSAVRTLAVFADNGAGDPTSALAVIRPDGGVLLNNLAAQVTWGELRLSMTYVL